MTWIVDFDHAKWKKSVAQITEVLDLLVTLPEDHPRLAPWSATLEALKDKVRRRKPLGKRDQAVVDNIEYVLRQLIIIGQLAPEDTDGQEATT